MGRSYYSESVKDFIDAEENYILGELSRNNQFSLDDLQRNTWIEEIKVLQRAFNNIEEGSIIFEYTIPRVGSRIDNVLIYKGILFLLEFKVGEKTYPKHAIEQVMDYALDLKNFHKESHNKKIVPILISTRAEKVDNTIHKHKDDVFDVLRCNSDNIFEEIEKIASRYSDGKIDLGGWSNSLYMPTPTIIEAAQALYKGHSVEEISRSDAGAYNLNITTKEINNIIDECKAENKKAICFITGVPGAGKTLAGLNIANSRHKFEEEEHAVFLSGNGPLVEVLQEALARNEVANSTAKIRKTDALKGAKAFIQNIHHFRDDALAVETAPIEKVTIFDEAQRAWTLEQTAKFMKEKKGKPDFDMSEPEFLISVMDRHEDWAVIICLIGGGQEINTGEAGLPEWFEAIKRKFTDWEVYVSNKLYDEEYTRGKKLENILTGLNYKTLENLHLANSLRSFRSERLSDFVKALLDCKEDVARGLLKEIEDKYPIFLTRDLDKAKDWIRTQARGTERYGLIASSGAKRLKTDGIWVQSGIEAKNWFLNDDTDVRASYCLEDTATEFDIQGLELDYTIVAWDADFRYQNNGYEHYRFVGTQWQNVNQDIRKAYLKNAYRVLLTRARQGMVIYVPKGNTSDITRNPGFYDENYSYLKSLGLKEL